MSGADVSAADVPTIAAAQLGARARNLHASPTSDVYVATLDGAEVVVKRTRRSNGRHHGKLDADAERKGAHPTPQPQRRAEFG